MTGEAIGEPIEPVTAPTLLECFALACGTGGPHEVSESARRQLNSVANAHRARCAVPGRLSWEAARLAAELVHAELTEHDDLEVAFTAIVLDRLMALNEAKLDWYEPESYPIALTMTLTGANEHLANWIDQHRSHRHRGRKVAFILGAMTSGDNDKLIAVRHRALRLKPLLEELGFRVHAPCTAPASRRPLGEAAHEDIIQISIADIVIVLPDPAALGVGILLGEAARRHAPTLFVAEATTDLTPIVSVSSGLLNDAEDDANLIRFIDHDEMLQRVGERVAAVSPDIDRRHAKHLRRLAGKAEMFEEYHESYRFAVDNGITITVPDVPEYRVRLICTRLEVFATATVDELSDISEAINEALYTSEADLDEVVTDVARITDATPEDSNDQFSNASHADANSHASSRQNLAQPRQESIPTHSFASYESTNLDDTGFQLIDEDPGQMELFSIEIDAVDAPAPGLALGEIEVLNPTERFYARAARLSLRLNDADYEYLLREARTMRKLEALTPGASRVDLGSGAAWQEFWRDRTDRA